MRRFGAGVLCAGLAALAAIAVYRLLERPRETPWEHQEEPEHVGAARYLNGAAAILSFSVLTDSAMEHYRPGRLSQSGDVSAADRRRRLTR